MAPESVLTFFTGHSSGVGRADTLPRLWVACVPSVSAVTGCSKDNAGVTGQGWGARAELQVTSLLLITSTMSLEETTGFPRPLCLWEVTLPVKRRCWETGDQNTVRERGNTGKSLDGWEEQVELVFTEHF